MVPFKDACILKHFGKDKSGLLLHDFQGIFRCDFILPAEAFRPVGVLLRQFVRSEIRTSATAESSVLSRAGSTASPMTSMRPMFSFLM